MSETMPTTDTTEFERAVRVRPAFDCEVIQPCVHGPDKCGTVPGYGHGRGSARMSLVLRGPVAEVILEITTGWYLPETPGFVRDDSPRLGACVEFHSSVPRYEGHEPQGSTCDRWPVCYGDVGYTMADEPAELLVRKGIDAVWEWLENAYRESFATVSAESSRGGES